MLGRLNRGFTLVELLVVISILGILAAALTTQVSKSRAMGQSVRCKANLKNLAQAALNYAVDNHSPRDGAYQPAECMPWAGSSEGSWPDSEDNFIEKYHLNSGWVSWTWSGPWLWTPRPVDPKSGSTKPACFYGENATTYHSLSNGVLWGYVGRDLATYVCDAHKVACKREGLDSLRNPIRRSYVMNAYFGYDYRVPSGAKKAIGRTVNLKTLSDRGNAGGLLLFAELPVFKFSGGNADESVARDLTASDGVLDTVIKNYYYNKAVTPNRWENSKPAKEEVIGFNHRAGKRFVAHVAFADGHVDAVVAPEKPDDAQLRDLTFLLCNGVDIPADSGDWKTARTDFLK